MAIERRSMCVLAVSLALSAAVACQRDQAGEIRERGERSRLEAGKLTLGDSSVVAELRAPREQGRIIYDPPVDLSYANAQRTRRDLVRGDTVPRVDTAARRSALRDTTAGDATADTSGGAARARRP